MLRENPLPGYAGDFSLLERKFSESTILNFTSGTHVGSVGEVAWLFKALENEAIEHTFVLYTFPDDSYLVQHLSSGGITSAVVDLRLLAGNVLKMKPRSITLVHNHPSGQLISSREDRFMLERLRLIFKDSSVKVEDGIIINLRSGKYLVFTPEKEEDEVREFLRPDAVQKQVKVYSFNKQVFAMNYQPHLIKNPEEAAAYLSAQKFGVSDKTEALLLNNASQVVGKFILPQRKMYDKLLELLTVYGATSTILYGNNITRKQYEAIKKNLELVGFGTLDALRLKSDNFYSVFSSLEIPLRSDLVDRYKTQEREKGLHMKEDRNDGLPREQKSLKSNYFNRSRFSR